MVVAVDRDPYAVGFKYSDVSINKSTRDAEGIITELDKLLKHYNWVGVINLSAGPPVITAAIICDYYEIPCIPTASARTIVNKDLLHNFCLEKRIPMPGYKVFSLKDKVKVENFDLPVVVKPGLSLIGKGGVSVVRNNEKFDLAVKNASEYTINKKIIVETYLPGSDHALLGFVKSGNYFPIIFLDEINKENSDGTVSRVGYKVHSPTEDNNLRTRIQHLSTRLAKGLSIERSPIITSFRLNEEGMPSLIEIHLDFGGDHIVDEILSRSLPYDFIELTVNMSTGVADPPKTNSIKPVAILYNDEGNGPGREKGFKIIAEESYEIFLEKIKNEIA